MQLLSLVTCVALQAAASAQAPSSGFAGLPAGAKPKVEIAWNRFYDYAELYEQLDRLVAA